MYRKGRRARVRHCKEGDTSQEVRPQQRCVGGKSGTGLMYRILRTHLLVVERWAWKCGDGEGDGDRDGNGAGWTG